jgi:hypothetical protein
LLLRGGRQRRERRYDCDHAGLYLLLPAMVELGLDQLIGAARGAHLLLQLRTRVLNDSLADDFHRWHPGFTHVPDRQALAA